MILLISSDDTLVEPMTTALPDFVSLVHLVTAEEAGPYLHSPDDGRPPAEFVVVDATDGPAVVAACRQVCQEASLSDIPIIAIVSEPAARQPVLEAGADDYLLQPLVPAETRSRLTGYLQTTLLDFGSLIQTIILRMGTGGSSHYLLNEKIQDLARLFGASAAWLLLLGADQKSVTLLSSYNLPPIFRQSTDALGVETLGCLEILHQNRTKRPQVIHCPFLEQANPQETNGLTHHLSIPLHNRKRFTGVLNLAYKKPPKISRAEKRTLNTLGRQIGILLEMLTLQEEMQVHATQNAFIVLLARTISERLDLNTILSLTLEQAVPLLDGSVGEIWLLSSDEQWLELVSSLSTRLYKTSAQQRRQAKGKGLKGWIVDNNRPAQLNVPTDDPRFDPQLDQIERMANYALLAMPLRHRNVVIGVLTIYSHRNTPFTPRDMELLEGITSLTASAIVNARLMQELREYANQQRILYEMGQQIAAGLNLQDTLNRVLQWIGRLFEAEIGLLWLIEPASNQPEPDAPHLLQLVAALGVDLPADEELTLSMNQGLMGWVARTGESVISNDPAGHPHFDDSLNLELNLTPRNILSVPMVSHDQTIGVVCLLNKIGDSFTESDLTLLSTVVDMVAVAVGNARLHTQTLSLMAEKEQLYKQILQSERLATMGRLTASLSHEINNPMQAIQGALTLALEELGNPAEVDMYLRMSLQESERVVKLINRLRQIYRPQAEAPETLNLNHLLQEALAIARKELKRQKVTVQLELAPQLPTLTVIANQIHLVFLSLILNLSDSIGAAGGGPLHICSYTSADTINVEFSTNVTISTLQDWDLLFKSDGPQEETNNSLGLSLSYDIIAAHGGRIRLTQIKENLVCQLEFPFMPADMSPAQLGQ